MATKFMTGGNTVHVFNMNSETALDALPPRIYTIKFNQFEGFFLGITKDKLELPEKIYGNTPQRVQKCLDTYRDRVLRHTYTQPRRTGHSRLEPR